MCGGLKVFSCRGLRDVCAIGTMLISRWDVGGIIFYLRSTGCLRHTICAFIERHYNMYEQAYAIRSLYHICYLCSLCIK